MTESGSGLQFDRAAYGPGAGGGAPCASCKGPLAYQYWRWQGQLVCADCRRRIEEHLAHAVSAGSFGKALLLGGGAALGCGIAYAVFVQVTNFQIAFATIGIAFVIARVVRKASGGVGGRAFQVLAVVLTYLASVMGYIPGLWSAAIGPEGISGIRLMVACAVLLIEPFLELTSSPLGAVIVGLGLWEAWKLSRGVPRTIDGPYQMAPAYPAAPPAATPPAAPPAQPPSS